MSSFFPRVEESEKTDCEQANHFVNRSSNENGGLGNGFVHATSCGGWFVY